MGDTVYKTLIDNMVWSYSRIKTFEDCPYRWFLKYIRPKVLISNIFSGKKPSRIDIDTAYIRNEIDKSDVGILYDCFGIKRKDMFFANYGTFMHKLIEAYLKHDKSQADIADIYMTEFKNEVRGRAPNSKVFANYFTSGLRYLKDIKPPTYNVIDIEKRIDVDICGFKFCGYIDVVGEKDGAVYVIDNKSRMLKPRSKRSKPTKSDNELDKYLRQLYLYSSYIKKQYGGFPKKLCFNCFRSNLLIEEPFSEQAYAESEQWLSDSISKIQCEKKFSPLPEFFKCTYLCELCDCCEYYSLMKEGDYIREQRT